MHPHVAQAVERYGRHRGSMAGLARRWPGQASAGAIRWSVEEQTTTCYAPGDDHEIQDDGPSGLKTAERFCAQPWSFLVPSWAMRRSRSMRQRGQQLSSAVKNPAPDSRRPRTEWENAPVRCAQPAPLSPGRAGPAIPPPRNPACPRLLYPPAHACGPGPGRPFPAAVTAYAGLAQDSAAADNGGRFTPAPE